MSIGHPYGFQGGTVMAMACMGDPNKYFDEFYKILKGNNTRETFDGMMDYYKFKEIVSRSEEDSFDVAAGAQRAFEAITRETLTPYIERFNPKNLCLSGGVVLNSVLVGKMYDWYPSVENIYVCPVPYDSGLAIGSAQYIYHQVLDEPRVKWNDNSSPYLGRTYDEKSVWSDLDKVSEKLRIKIVDDEVVARLLSVDNNDEHLEQRT